nr:sulfite exporter TauE/SafE family protein [Actinomycetota bacterium]
WGAVLPLAVGFLAGGRLGPVIVRRAPATPIRIGICVAGLGLAVHLGLDAYR